MMTLHRRKVTLLLLLLALFTVTLIASLAIIHATHPSMWQHIQGVLPDVINHT